jgi:hypothetical protein
MSRQVAQPIAAILLLGLLSTACADRPPPVATPTPGPTLAASAVTPTPEYWASLTSRPLQLPKIGPGETCPRSTASIVDPHYSALLGDSPIYLLSGGDAAWTWYTTLGKPDDGRYPLGPGEWRNDPSYLGPAVLRGGSIDGSGNCLEFKVRTARHGQRAIPVIHLPLDPRDLGAPHADMRQYWVTSWVSGGGCYAYQIDGIGFTETIVVELVIRPPDANGS